MPRHWPTSTIASPARLAFGTAGLRGELGAGSNRMNRVLVAQAAAGLAAFLLERADAGRRRPTVVDRLRRAPQLRRLRAGLRRDLRRARASGRILLPRLLPTPVLAFAVRHLGADAGVMVTASHNPPDDNGYKVYLGGDDDGAQIVPPADAEIAAHIQRVADEGDVARAPALARLRDGAASRSSTRTSPRPPRSPPRPRAPRDCAGSTPRCTASAGRRSRAILDAAGYPAPDARRRSRSSPTGASRPSRSPTPRSPARWTSRSRPRGDAAPSSIIANDPDADRLAVAIPDADADGGWRRLTATRSGCCSAGAPAASARRRRRAGRGARARPDAGAPHRWLLARLVAGPPDGRRALRPRLPRDPHRLQVDLAGARASCSGSRRRSATS